MFCPNCGKDAGEAAFCPECGQSIQKEPASTPSKQSGLAENIAGLLCYLLGWFTGIIFALIDKRSSVRFHAMQSIVTFGGLSVLYYLLAFIIMILPYSIGHLFSLLQNLISLAGLVLWIILMVKAYQGERFVLPIAGNMAEQWSGTSQSS